MSLSVNKALSVINSTDIKLLEQKFVVLDRKLQVIDFSKVDGFFRKFLIVLAALAGFYKTGDDLIHSLFIHREIEKDQTTFWAKELKIVGKLEKLSSQVLSCRKTHVECLKVIKEIKKAAAVPVEMGERKINIYKRINIPIQGYGTSC